MIAVKTCGKLYWAGEYAILEPGQLALIKAIPIYMRGEIAFSDSYRIYSDMFDLAVDLTPNPDYSLIQETIALVEDFLVYRGQTLRPFFRLIRSSCSSWLARSCSSAETMVLWGTLPVLWQKI